MIEEGRARRDEGIELAEGARGAEYDRSLIDQAILHLAQTREHFSANEVRDMIPVVRPALMGARFRAARLNGLIEPAGSIQATSASRHANWMHLWHSCIYRSSPINWPALFQIARFED